MCTKKCSNFCNLFKKIIEIHESIDKYKIQMHNLHNIIYCFYYILILEKSTI